MKSVYINLDSRTDRRQQFEEEAERMKLSIERFPAIQHSVGGIGCTKSHIEVLKQAREQHLPEVMIFEDDFEFLVSREEFDSILASVPDDYDVVMLSYNLQRSEPYNERFGRVLDVQTTSGYLVSSRFYDTLLATWEASLAQYETYPECHWLYILDQAWKPLQPISKWYYSLVRIGKQRPGWSDITNGFVDYEEK
jgi:GR25 family glycosyltransferase involved in LPS biosynthesis